MAAASELDSQLQQLAALKPPGASKTLVSSVTTLCVENVKSESILIQRIYTHFKRAPPTHKLGLLYIVDSVARHFIEQAQAAAQELSGSAAPEGTFASGVHKLTELLPLLTNEIIATAPEDQKEKLWKLVDIWERGQIFPLDMVEDFKKKLDAYKPPSSASAPVSQSRPLARQSSTIASAGSIATTGEARSRDEVLANMTPEQANALAAVIPSHVMSDPEALAEHLKLLQQLTDMGVPQEKWPEVIAAVQAQKAQKQIADQQPSNPSSNRDGSSSRQRSRSPQHQQRPSPGYNRNESGSGRYRDRSPVHRSHSPSMQEDKILLAEPKWTDYDPSLPEGCIKVLSRTLFVGGTNCNEDELRQVFSRFGDVQTVTINHEKHHAFIKMCNRAGAIAAKEGMDAVKAPEVLSRVRSTKWGIGFGPRECANYSSGISIIPIQRLTEADKRWVLTAEYGGTGGKHMEPGIVMEEPDIEIGAGVSSKAMSRRLESHAEHSTPRRVSSNPHNKSFSPASRGNFDSHRKASSRPRAEQHQHHQHQHQHQQRSAIASDPPRGRQQSNVQPTSYEGAPPAVPGFGFQLPSAGATSNTNRPSKNDAPPAK